MTGARKSLDELGIEIHSIQDAAKKMEAHQRLANMREKVRTEEAKKSRNDVLQKGDSGDPNNHVSKEDLELLQQNRELEGAVRQGRGADGTARDAKVNL